VVLTVPLIACQGSKRILPPGSRIPSLDQDTFSRLIGLHPQLLIVQKLVDYSSSRNPLLSAVADIRMSHSGVWLSASVHNLLGLGTKYQLSMATMCKCLSLLYCCLACAHRATPDIQKFLFEANKAAAVAAAARAAAERKANPQLQQQHAPALATGAAGRQQQGVSKGEGKGCSCVFRGLSR
jgi:hypothetical protein